MVEQSQAFSPREEGIKVKFLGEGKAVFFCVGAYNIEIYKWSKMESKNKSEAYIIIHSAFKGFCYKRQQ